MKDIIILCLSLLAGNQYCEDTAVYWKGKATELSKVSDISLDNTLHNSDCAKRFSPNKKRLEVNLVFVLSYIIEYYVSFSKIKLILLIYFGLLNQRTSMYNLIDLQHFEILF